MRRYFTPCFALLAGAGLALGQVEMPPAGDTVIVPEAASEVSWAEEVADPCGPRFWVSGEYLRWWLKDSTLPVLVTTGSPDDLIPGALGSPSTRPVLFGSAGPEEFSGGRFTAGLSLGAERRLGVEGSFFFLDKQTDRLGVSSSGEEFAPVLSRPFFNVTQHLEDVDPVAFPFVQAGAVRVELTSELWGAEANLRAELCGGGALRAWVLGGCRYLELEEGLSIVADTQDLPGVGGGNRSVVVDQFRTRNRFYGGQAGLMFEACRGNFLLDLCGKVALGGTQERLGISGARRITTATGEVNAFAAGLLAQPSNSGTFEETSFAVVPEVNINLGYQVTGGLRAAVGYTFLYWSDVARPADQIDRSVNTTQLPPNVLTGPARPLPIFNNDDFWAQGLNVKLELRY